MSCLPEWFAAASFDAVPVSEQARAFGVDYAVLRLPEGDVLYLTRFGWPWREHLLPARWYAGGGYFKRGTRLTRSTGTVYRVTTTVRDRPLVTVAKISRVAQHLEPDELLTVPGEEPSFAAFLSPFEEFGAVLRLRHSRLGPPIVTKRPLAILCPARTFRPWELGRDDSWFAWHADRLERDQREAGGRQLIGLHPARDYLAIFQWIDGLTLLELRACGIVDDQDIREIMLTVIAELDRHRVRVLDHKPDHVIVRPRPDGTLPTRNGRLVYAIADYELLVSTPEAAMEAA
jgi:hypothetical protein